MASSASRGMARLIQNGGMPPNQYRAFTGRSYRLDQATIVPVPASPEPVTRSVEPPDALGSPPSFAAPASPLVAPTAIDSEVYTTVLDSPDSPPSEEAFADAMRAAALLHTISNLRRWQYKAVAWMVQIPVIHHQIREDVNTLVTNIKTQRSVLEREITWGWDRMSIDATESIELEISREYSALEILVKPFLDFDEPPRKLARRSTT